jgi:hypothetical protein
METFIGPSKGDLLVCLLVALAGGLAIRHGEFALGFIIFLMSGFGMFSTMVEIVEGRL